ncbi:MAG: hypothetical protein U9Q70_09105, partial [Chloroflexota bacterium]|nr:hypothetical protein [Chloroflexota bacterium]
TATVWAVTAQAEAAHATATQRTAYEQATATQQASSEHATVTQQAAYLQSTATVGAQRATETVAANIATATAQVAMTTETFENALRAEQLTRARLETRRAELVQPLKAYGPWALLIASMLLLGVALWKFTVVLTARQRVVETGTGLVLVLDENGHRTQLPQNNWGPVLDVKQPLSLPNPAQQDEVTRRAQTVQAIKAQAGSHGGRPRQAAQLLNQGRHGSQPQPTLRLGRVQSVRKLNHAAQVGLVAPQLTTAIEADWKKNVIEGQYREVEND